MVSFDEFKKALGETAKGLTDEQILKLRDQQDQLAEILFYLWLKEINNKKKVV